MVRGYGKKTLSTSIPGGDLATIYVEIAANCDGYTRSQKAFERASAHSFSTYNYANLDGGIET